MNNENSYGSESKVLSIHATKVYEGAEI